MGWVKRLRINDMEGQHVMGLVSREGGTFEDRVECCRVNRGREVRVWRLIGLRRRL